MPIDPKTAAAMTPAEFDAKYGAGASEQAGPSPSRAELQEIVDRRRAELGDDAFVPAGQPFAGSFVPSALILEAARRELAEPAVPIVNRVYRVIMPNGQAHDLTQYQAEQLRDDLTRTIAP